MWLPLGLAPALSLNISVTVAPRHRLRLSGLSRHVHWPRTLPTVTAAALLIWCSRPYLG